MIFRSADEPFSSGSIRERMPDAWHLAESFVTIDVSFDPGGGRGVWLPKLWKVRKVHSRLSRSRFFQQKAYDLEQIAYDP